MPFLVALAVFLLVLIWGLRGRPASFAAQVRDLAARPTKRPGTIADRVQAALRLSGLRLGTRQVFLAVGGLSLLLAAGAYRLSGSFPVSLVMGGLGIAYPLLRLRQFEQKRRETLALQFKEALTSVTYSLRAGASLHTAMERALGDLRRIFPGPVEPIVLEFEGLVQQLRLGVPIEAVLSDWAVRIRLEDVSDFVAATVAVKRRGGNLAEVMSTVSETISWKIVAQAQIRALTAEKRSEAGMLIAVPPVVLVLLWLLSPQYLAPLFTTGAGQVILFIAALCNVLAFFATRKVLESPL